MSAPLRIVIGNASLAQYPIGGGHWACLLQHFLGLRALGHEAYWYEILRRCGNSAEDESRCTTFFQRMEDCGLADRCLLVICDEEAPPLPETADVRGMSRQRAIELVQGADLLWNLTCAIRQPLLGRFRRRALIDLDPGEIQVVALTCNLGIRDHEIHFTVGLNLGGPRCESPDLDLTWHPFAPLIHLPFWKVTRAPADGPITSITQWTWHEILYEGKRLSLGKREAYLAYADLPRRSGQRFELAANFHPNDSTGDREAMQAGGWELVHPHDLVPSPATYQEYIARSRAEICCPKPIHRELQTGWFSDRSAAYLASGRPVLFERTGFEGILPTGSGLITFLGIEEALHALDDLNQRYDQHCRAARGFAEEHLDAAKILPRMIDLCR